MPGYKQPCRYCGGLISQGSNVCPLCGRVNPLGSPRCPRCRNPVQEGWVACSNCGLGLKITCPHCGRETFFGDYCQECDARLVVVCPHRKCGAEQPPLGDTCIKCGKAMR
ncbi:MAG: zinc ribbon domain-containing protein [Actinomycetota bacterium]|nr:zinc ribbon domain-containing protein [Actinomycetota bacterium]MDD5667272.1 zinc ribbon domain-containing protein [Actinomycetota bacterium]